MKRTELTAEDFKAMVAIGAERLSENAEYVNSLNVFPVPDGDTGTNMNLSFTSGAERVRLSNAATIDQLGADLAKGLLMGAGKGTQASFYLSYSEDFQKRSKAKKL